MNEKGHNHTHLSPMQPLPPCPLPSLCPPSARTPLPYVLPLPCGDHPSLSLSLSLPSSVLHSYAVLTNLCGNESDTREEVYARVMEEYTARGQKGTLAVREVLRWM